MTYFNSFIVILIIAIQALFSFCYSQSVKTSGDILEFAIPTIAFVTTLGLSDFQGSKQFLKGIATTTISTYVLKSITQEKRPHHYRFDSFPSGHSAIAFFGSGFIHKRYGFKYAVPAYAAAIFVSYSRLKTKEHWIQDVIGGAAVGLLWSYFWTTPYQFKSYQIYPEMSHDSVKLFCEKQF